MVESVGGKALGIGVDLQRQAQVTVTDSPKPAQSVPLALGVTALSPRMRADPVAGVLITEYLSDDGQIEQQYPSEVAVAYLRSGLMENGTPSPDALNTDNSVLV